ncbi:MAG: hypothetical protein ABNH53_14205 [Henriciella sp.]|jgi:CBS domain containing-hemolysin-like protein
MARRSSVARRSRRDQIRKTEAQKLVDPQKEIKDFLHHLKILSIKNRVTKTAMSRVPFAWVAIVLTGLFLLVTILTLSLLGIIIAVAAFGGSISQLYGPIGAYTRRKEAREYVEQTVRKCAEVLPSIMSAHKIVIFGVNSISKRALRLNGEVKPIDAAAFNTLSQDGQFDLGDYKYLGVAFREDNGTLNFKDLLLSDQEWLLQARVKGLNDDIIAAQLAAIS